MPSIRLWSSLAPVSVAKSVSEERHGKRDSEDRGNRHDLADDVQRAGHERISRIASRMVLKL